MADCRSQGPHTRSPHSNVSLLASPHVLRLHVFQLLGLALVLELFLSVFLNVENTAGGSPPLNLFVQPPNWWLVIGSTTEVLAHIEFHRSAS